MYSFPFGSPLLALGGLFPSARSQLAPAPCGRPRRQQSDGCVCDEAPSFRTSQPCGFARCGRACGGLGEGRNVPRTPGASQGARLLRAPTVTCFLRAYDSSCTDAGTGHNYSRAPGLFPGGLGDPVVAQAGRLRLKRSDSG